MLSRFFFFSSRRRHTRLQGDWSSDVCSSDLELGDDADNIRIDADGNRLFVGFGKGAIAEIDVAKKSKIAEFAVPAHPEGFQLDRKANRIFVNVPTSRAIVVIDGLTGKQIATWP